MKLYLIRHGETDFNSKNIIQGSLNNAMNSEGLLQSKAIGKRLSSITLNEIQTSPLIRAIETAKTIHSLQKCPNSIDYTETALLCNRKLGEDEGKSKDYFYSLNTFTGRNHQPKNGESINQLHFKTQILLNDLIKKYIHKDFVLNHTMDSLNDSIKCISEKKFSSNQAKGKKYVNKELKLDVCENKLAHVALVTHGMVISEIINNVLLKFENEMIFKFAITNVALFVLVIKCSTCDGKCLKSSEKYESKHQLCYSFEVVNDYSHLENKN